MGLDDVFREPPVWDTDDSSSSESTPPHPSPWNNVQGNARAPRQPLQPDYTPNPLDPNNIVETRRREVDKIAQDLLVQASPAQRDIADSRTQKPKRARAPRLSLQPDYTPNPLERFNKDLKKRRDWGEEDNDIFAQEFGQALAPRRPLQRDNAGPLFPQTHQNPLEQGSNNNVKKRRDWGEEVKYRPPPSFSENSPVLARHPLLRADNGPKASLVNGNNAIGQSVLSDRESRSLRTNAQVGSTLSPEDSSRSLVSFVPRRLLDIENGRSVIMTNDESLFPQNERDGNEKALVVSTRSLPPVSERDPTNFRNHTQSLRDRIMNGQVRDFQANNEVGFLGGLWRGCLMRLMVRSYDEANALLLTRQIQLFMPFLTGYEAYVLGQVIEAFESGRKKDLVDTLSVAFQNRNVSRILVQIVGQRYDFLWHWSTMITWNRPFDAWGQLPFVGFTAFPATENISDTRNHALASIARVLLGQGTWVARVLTGREGLVTDDINHPAQNLAAESNGFEVANRNQFGTHVGRRKTNEFRFMHRLPTDESIVRTFFAQPMSTMVNNGVVHVLRQLAKHWHDTLQEGNAIFAQQRMEQLNPFETLRFHMPVVLLTLSSLRGRNRWDCTILGPLTKRLQNLKPSCNVDSARSLVEDLKGAVVNVSGGTSSIVDPFQSWLNAIDMSLDLIEDEAQKVHEIVSSVEIGIRLGHDLVTQMSWKIPSSETLKAAILNHILGQEPMDDVPESRIRTAMGLITPRDKRTLIELVKNGLTSTRPAQLLLSRAKTLLQRELRRDILNETILELSGGHAVVEPKEGDRYWLQVDDDAGVYVYDGRAMGNGLHRFLHIDSSLEKTVDLLDANVKCSAYVPVGESISRAQRAFMDIELDHGKTFAYNAFMEFSYLRENLRHLIVISQMACEELDNARLNLLVEVQRSNLTQVSNSEVEPGKTYYTYRPKENEYLSFIGTSDGYGPPLPFGTSIVKVPPQSMLVVGGGPTGLVTAIHCTEAVLASGGEMKLYEARDAFSQGAATFERAQIVRLDARWIAMLRYHLGTGFEDVFIPASGETDSQLGNTLPTQGFVEITIKDLENMLHLEVSKLWSKGLVSVYTNSKATYDPVSNTLEKMGSHLKIGDSIKRNIDEEGRLVREYDHSWKVVDVMISQPLEPKDLSVGQSYGIPRHPELKVVKHRLVSVDLRTQTYIFAPVDGQREELNATVGNWPTIYPVNVGSHGDVDEVIVECNMPSESGGYVRESLPMERIKSVKYVVDVGRTHVVEAIGKPHDSKVHFQVTTSEPYGVCCAQGLKVSLGMHNFGEKRWEYKLVDDARSPTDQNTRIIGDFTKMVRMLPVAEKMHKYMTCEHDRNWQIHFKVLMIDSGLIGISESDNAVQRMQQACGELVTDTPTFRRQTLQTRFFETGDNYYLGMEFMREYISWRNDLVSEIVKDASSEAEVGRLKSTLMHHIDRLCYEGVLEVIRTGDVYNPGARHRVPRLHMINSHTDQRLGGLDVGESFRLSDSPEEKYEVLVKRPFEIVVRNVEGCVSKMSKSTLVKREGDLTRSPNGNSESRVALATFPVAHYVNHRSVRLNDSENGYVFAFIGDEQATPHFMRYSGLTGACINAMLFNNFIKEAFDGVPFLTRLDRYASETDWSNSEVVHRGTGNSFGEDGFLRPGFSYRSVVDFLHAKLTEWEEVGQIRRGHLLSLAWKDKIAASLVPRGLESNAKFKQVLRSQFTSHVWAKFRDEASKDPSIARSNYPLLSHFELARNTPGAANAENFWDAFAAISLSSLSENERRMSALPKHIHVARMLNRTLDDLAWHTEKSHLYNLRISSELFNQPKPVDSIVDDLAVEAQRFSTSLTQSAAFASGSLAFKVFGETAASAFSVILAVLNIGVSFGTLANVARYKIRNEEARVIFADTQMHGVIKAVFAAIPKQQQNAVPPEENPFLVRLEQLVVVFLKNVKYYDYGMPVEFEAAYENFKSFSNDEKEVLFFTDLVVEKFIGEIYHENSYLQENLVAIYRVLDELYKVFYSPNALLEDEEYTEDGEALDLFRRLNLFQSELEGTLQRGATCWGFVKRRPVFQWDVIVMFKYLYSLLCCSSRFCMLPTAPTSTKTSSIIKQAEHLSRSRGSKILRREIRDLKSLHWATRESDIASLVFMSGFLVFISSITFTIAFIFRITVLTNVAFWLTLTSAFGAILGAFHLWRKLLLLIKLAATLDWKVRTAASDDRENIRKIRNVTIAQILLTVTRLLTAGAAAVALPWSVANKAFGEDIVTYVQIPFLLALGSVCAAVFSTLFFFLVEYRVRYNLPPKLGEFVCESFRDEIEAMYVLLSVSHNDIDPKQVQERETWEYVAREFLHQYRFDAVFAADRFGSILQYLQGGMDRRQ